MRQDCTGAAMGQDMNVAGSIFTAVIAGIISLLHTSMQVTAAASKVQ